MQQLALCVRVHGHANAPFAECFAEEAETVEVICAEIRDEEVYWYAPRTYSACREKLDEGMRRLLAFEEKLKKEGLGDHFTEMKEKGEHCQACFDAYANAWSAILECCVSCGSSFRLNSMRVVWNA